MSPIYGHVLATKWRIYLGHSTGSHEQYLGRIELRKQSMLRLGPKRPRPIEVPTQVANRTTTCPHSRDIR